MVLQVWQCLVVFVAGVLTRFTDPVRVALLAAEVVVSAVACLIEGGNHTLCRLF
jgi:hypothetical protein